VRLTLTTLRCPDTVAPETRVVTGGEYSIGRGPDNDWILTDPHRLLGRRHCLVAFRSGQWQISDMSKNGTFLNHEASPIGDRTRPLHSGDRLGLGAYELEVEISDGIAEADRQWRSDEQFHPEPRGFTAKPALTPFTPEFPGSYAGQNPARSDIGLPDDFNPFDDGPGHEGLRGPPQSDHSPSIEDAFRPPRAIVPLPDDWADVPEAAVGGSVPRPAAPPPASPPSVAPSGDLMGAFLRGAGAEGARPEDPVRTMQTLGEVLRATVAGLRQTLIARLSVKSEFRIEQTMIRASGNNPLKFSADDDDALAALLGVGRRNTMPPAAAVTEALRDIRLHELATVAAMQQAVRALLGRLDPAALERQAAPGGFGKLLSQGKARAWDAFVARHMEVSQALSDDFDSVFGKAFARAYEQAMRDLTEREDRR
jgi:type VI secretion system protein ImpI/type VI secretion system protein